ncbi:MAG: glycosyltransferase family 2 protein, partial [Acidobacteriota bacterium]
MVDQAAAPRVSVLLRTKDRPDLLAEALASLRAQTFSDFEVVLVNDGGPIPPGLLDPAPGRGVRVVVPPRPGGRSRALNAGLAASRGTWVAYLDDDDLYLPDHLAVLDRARAGGARAAHTSVRQVRQARGADGAFHDAGTITTYERPVDAGRLLYKNDVPLIALGHERILADEAGGFDESFDLFEDWDFLIRLAKLTPIRHVPEVTAVYRVRAGSSVTETTPWGSPASQEARRRLYEKHAPLMTSETMLAFVDAALGELDAALGREKFLVGECGRLSGEIAAAQVSAIASCVRCDLVIPVYNALRSTRACLESVRRFAPPWARVVVINDASDSATTEWLRARAGIVLLENAENLGFVRTANRGLLYSDAPWVCLLNSDTLLTEGALERMVTRCERDPVIGMCCPLSNGAVNLTVKVPPGEDVFSFARRVARTSPALYPDAVTIVGFCLLVKREVLKTLGVFDEVFGRGYCEETDLHYRARAAGWRCVVADDTWIHHRNGGSFTDGGARTERNMEILMSRWREFHEREIREFDRRNDLGAVRDVSTYEWTRPDDRPPDPHDVLVLVSGEPLSAAAASQLELANACVLAGMRAGAVALDGADPGKEMELWFRPYRLSAAELLKSPPPTRAWIAADPETRSLAARLPVRPAPVDPAALFSRGRSEPRERETGMMRA